MAATPSSHEAISLAPFAAHIAAPSAAGASDELARQLAALNAEDPQLLAAASAAVRALEAVRARAGARPTS